MMMMMMTIEKSIKNCKYINDFCKKTIIFFRCIKKEYKKSKFQVMIEFYL